MLKLLGQTMALSGKPRHCSPTCKSTKTPPMQSTSQPTNQTGNQAIKQSSNQASSQPMVVGIQGCNLPSSSRPQPALQRTSQRSARRPGAKPPAPRPPSNTIQRLRMDPLKRFSFEKNRSGSVLLDLLVPSKGNTLMEGTSIMAEVATWLTRQPA